MTVPSAQPVSLRSGSPAVVELTGISASFTPLELEGLIRTAAEAVYGDEDDLSSRQRELASRAYTLMVWEAEADFEEKPAVCADGASSPSGYARLLALQEQLRAQALIVETEFTELLRALFPQAAHMVLRIGRNDSFILSRAVTAQGATVHLFDDPDHPMPALPEELARAWGLDPQLEPDLDHIVGDLQEAGVTFGSLPEEARDLEIGDRYEYIPSLSLETAT
ncbi:hypothetical protein EF919_40645 [Streptomyces sp. WAC02707]|uniref:hypothetical protein n=1 Tax=Streptomyces sp. WAC02707 TaxID=2487417 RepID=UPI000F7928E1|nr:hypothetical protein [Streptomyces sp. WAC02707]RSS80417.1 hypothetical protein EF919_40645 [Streptomyces sp. WAC02707]